MRSYSLGLILVLVSAGASACASAPAVEAADPTRVHAPLESASASAGAEGTHAEVVDATSGGETPQAALLPNGREPLPSVVTGGAPSQEQLQAAHAAGFKTVISLLPETDPEAEQVRALGMSFVSIPVAGPQDLTEDNARKLGEAMDRAGAKPLLLHCASGNRAGGLLALKAFFVDHMAPQDAIALGESAGLASLGPAVEQAMQQGEPAQQ